jgi:hypothetical protein
VDTAQVIFSIALGVVALAVVAFAAFVLSTTMWGNRWVRRGR